VSFRLIEADCIEAMASMDEASVDAIVTDPPYGLEFMGKEWDSFRPNARSGRRRDGGPSFGSTMRYQEQGVSAQYAAQAWHQAWATEALRVLKPGGHLLAFGGTRTYHRLACALENAGFEIRDCLAWLYWSGFPKSLDVSKAIDKAAGAEREVIGKHVQSVQTRGPQQTLEGGPLAWQHDLTTPATPEAQTWQGWGTALKPAFEPIVLARKPLIGSVAQNVLEHGTGALNIDGTRIEMGGEYDPTKMQRQSANNPLYVGGAKPGDEMPTYNPSGRWPANVLLDEEAAAMLDEQSGERPVLGHYRNPDEPQQRGARSPDQPTDSWFTNGPRVNSNRFADDSGGASRFFYIAKADREERNRGLEHRAEGPTYMVENGSKTAGAANGVRYERHSVTRNSHPTVKPVELMQWLCRLITPHKGIVLDPLTGSGSTGIAALREGFEFIGVEREPEYVEIARDRILGDAPLFNVEAL
jgi:DNA modification methylase